MREKKIKNYVIPIQDDRDEHDAPIESESGEMLEVDATDSIDQQSDPVYDYQLDIDCNEMPITIDELSMNVNNNPDIGLDAGKLNCSLSKPTYANKM